MPSTLTLMDYADKELLGVLTDVADDDGWADTTDIAVQLALDNARANQCVGVRLAWLRRFGITEVHERGHRWRLTAIGEVFLGGELDAGQRSALNGMPPEQLLTLTRWVTSRYRRVGAPAGHMIRREWTHGTQRP